MAMDFDAVAMPADIVAALSLTVGTRYTLQHVGTLGTVLVRPSTTAVTAQSRGFKLEAGGGLTFRADAGEGVYVWVGGADRAPCIVEEVA